MTIVKMYFLCDMSFRGRGCANSKPGVRVNVWWGVWSPYDDGTVPSRKPSCPNRAKAHSRESSATPAVRSSPVPV